MDKINSSQQKENLLSIMCTVAWHRAL